ncbi:MAG: aminopeptidase P family protein [Planctomycetales bacterium]|nr:aminopeptidase P family protein [Planctomycetales bacterium]
MNHAGRRDKLRKQLKREGLDALLVTNFLNVTYLTGFTGDDSYLLVTPTDAIIISDLRYDTQLHDECPDVELCIRGPGTKMLDFVVKTVEKAGARRMGFEADSMTVGLRDAVADALPKVELAATSGWVEELRMIKDKDEINRTRVACDQARRAFEVVRAGITPETTENQIAADLEYQVRRFGGKGLSFTPIVGVGYRAALPHGMATDRKIGEADFVLIDWGANEGLYMSDLTRVLATGKISPKLRKLYNIVLKAQLAGIAAIKPGATCEAVDAAARSVIEKAGHGKAFGHGLGHGTGLEIHEAPRLAKGQKTELKPGMIVTVEPGIYFPEWGGIRIEDDILVTRDGHEVLSSVPKELDESVAG